MRAVRPFLCLSLGLLLPGTGLAQYFGKNKVQYKQFDFRVISTDHFDVYFYPQEREAALDAARMAERAYTRLSRILGHEFKDRKPIILYASHSDFQQTNTTPADLPEGTGGFTEPFKNRMVLPFTGSYAEFERVLVHELVHAFQFDVYSRAGILGGNPFSGRPPLWFMEGMAEYLSVGRVDPHTAMWLRDAALQGYLVDIPTLSRLGDIRVYRFGQSIWEFLGTKYGDGVIGEILQKAARMGLDKALQSTIGIDLKGLSEAWTEAVRVAYLPQIAEFQKAEKVARPLTDHVNSYANFHLAPALSPDGRLVAYISDRDFYNDIFLASALDGRIVAKLVKGERTESFESLRFLQASMSWSFDGRWLAFAAKKGGEDALYILDVKEREVVASYGLGLDGIVGPSWSPGGERLVFSGIEGGITDLFVVNRDGTGLTRLTDDRYTDRDPAWSPDGKRIAFTTDRGPQTAFDRLTFAPFRIALYDVETGEITILPDQVGKNVNPQWSKDGTKLAFVSDRTGISNVFIYNLAEETLFQVTNILTGVTGIVPASPTISWATKESRLVFTAFTRGGWNLYALDDPVAMMTPYEPSAVIAERGSAREPEEPAPAPPEQLEDLEARSVYLAEIDPSLAHSLSKEGETDLREVKAETVVALPDTSDFKVRDYHVSFSPDLVGQPSVGFASNIGLFGGSFISLSDILGDHNIVVSANLFGSLLESDLFAAYTYLKSRTNYGAALFQFRRDLFSFIQIPGNVDVRSQIFRGAEVFARRPFSRFRRVEGGLQVVSIDDRVLRVNFIRPTAEKVADLGTFFYLSPSLAYVMDNVIYGSTGPIAGRRFRFEIQQAVGDLEFTQFTGDFRNYINLSHRFVFASRFIYATSQGRDEQLFFIGGPLTIRGFDFGDLRGTNIGIHNFELRTPLIDVFRMAFPLSLSLPPIRGVLFVDTGFADFPGRPFQPFRSGGTLGFHLNDFKLSYGVGIRIPLYGISVLRLDYARQTNLEEAVGAPHGVIQITLAPEF